MNLAENLRLLRAQALPGIEVPQTEAELLSAICVACEAQARSGRKLLRYVWALPITTENLEKCLVIQDKVLESLRTEGLKIESQKVSSELLNEKVWNEWILEFVVREVRIEFLVEW